MGGVFVDTIKRVQDLMQVRDMKKKRISLSMKGLNK